ncbi:MAG: DUF1367 family protein [Aeromonas sp.]
MSVEVSLIKQVGGVWLAASPADQEASAALPLGTLLTGKGVSQRNSRFHRKFFALLNLGFDYWQSKGGLVSPAEEAMVQRFAQFLAGYSADPAALRRAGGEFLAQLAAQRAERWPEPSKSFEAYRKWVVAEAGFYTAVTLPNGCVRKEAQSLKFGRMSQDEFAALYRAAFAVIWRHVLVNTFTNEAEAEQAINQLLGYDG